MTKTKPTYEALNSELDAIIASLQQEEIDIDAAVQLYQRGLELSKQLEEYLVSASNTIEELKASFVTK